MKPPAPSLAVAVVSTSLFLLVLGTAGGCAKPAAKAGERQTAAESATGSSAESPSAAGDLEEKAAAYSDRFKEIQESDMTADEKAQAAGELVDEQQRTIREAEDGTAAEAEGDSQE